MKTSSYPADNPEVKWFSRLNQNNQNIQKGKKSRPISYQFLV